MIKLNLEELQKRAEQRVLKGIYWINEDDYHSGPGISSTDIKNLQKSAAHYKAAIENRKSTPAMEFGRALHCLFLEPDKYRDQYITEPDFGDKRSKAVRDKVEAWKEANTGKICIDIQTRLKLHEMHEAYKRTPRYSQIHEGAICELSAYAMDQDAAVLKKARADLIQGPTIFDLKTTEDARPQSFTKTIMRYGYHISAAYYLDTFNEAGREVDSFVWIALEKDPPYGVRMYVASENMIKIGRKKYKEALKVYRESEKSGIWTAYECDFEPIEFSDYVLRDELDG